MSVVAEVRLWGTTVGAVSFADGDDTASFEYAPEFIGSGIELSPLRMPLSRRVYRFPELPRPAFHGLPGLLADSLPDRFGNALIDAWLARQGRGPDSFNALERLCYTGVRGMGALEFFPARGPEAKEAQKLEIDRLVKLASDVLSRRGELRVNWGAGQADEALDQILRVGTSAGGARAKAVVAWNPLTNEVRSGQLSVPEGFEHWLIKFDGVASSRDKEMDDPKGFGAIEYAYHLMAKAAGIVMTECRLLEENGRRHFMTRRFDRLPGGGKLHVQTLGALAHFDFNAAGAHGYEEAFMAMRSLGLGGTEAEELFRRMVFNILARNQDDHVKNIAFIMNRRGEWTLSPAYDVTYSCRPAGLWTGTHQMSVNGLREGFAWDDLKAVAVNAGLMRGRAEAVYAQVRDALSSWKEFASAAGVPEPQSAAIEAAFRSLPFPRREV